MSGTRVAETILASVRMRARQQAGHMDASDLIKSLQRKPCEEGAVHIWGPDADQRAKLSIYRAVEASILDACSQPDASIEIPTSELQGWTLALRRDDPQINSCRL